MAPRFLGETRILAPSSPLQVDSRELRNPTIAELGIQPKHRWYLYLCLGFVPRSANGRPRS